VEGIERPRLLRGDDETADFDCGFEVLNLWLKRRALQNHLSGASRTTVASAGKRVVGFYCLAAGAIQHEAAPGKIRRNMPDPIPALVLGRLAVDVNFQKRGIGPALLLHALDEAQAIAHSVGIRALLVHAKDPQAAAFYRHFGFAPSPLDELILMAQVKAI
jgi:GNAT superfamily N-acetyltransferase